MFIGHEGFEGAEAARHDEGLDRRKDDQGHGWKVNAGDIPADRDEQVEWLYENWAEMDAWLVRGSKAG